MGYDAKYSLYLKLADRTTEINRANGFSTPVWEGLSSKLMFVVTEINEAVSEYRLEHRKSFDYELADIAIRLLDILQSVWPRAWTLREFSSFKPDEYAGVRQNLWGILERICDATESWGHEEKVNTLIHLEMALVNTRKVAKLYAVDLPRSIDEKLIINSNRGFLHGKKRKEG